MKDIEDATFLCIDGEFTGLNNGYNVNTFDTPADSYNKIRSGSMDFLFIQFGLSIFTRDENTGRCVVISKFCSASYILSFIFCKS